MPKISVIIPVYNAENYLRECLDSVLAQTFTDFEVLLINDGSTDASGKICDEYAEKDSRIKVFHNENKGVSMTRNFALRKIKGKYSIHIDSDDTVENNYLKELILIAEIEETDMVICDVNLLGGKQDKTFKQGPIKSNDLYIKGLFNGEYLGSMCNKLIKTNLYKKFDVTFPTNFNLCEDLFVNINLLIHPIKVSYINLGLYNYNYRGNSITNKVDCNYHYDFSKFLEAVYKNKNIRKKFEHEILRRILGTKISMIKDDCFDNYDNRNFFNKSNKLIIIHRDFGIRLKALLAMFYILPLKNIVKRFIQLKHNEKEN